MRLKEVRKQKGMTQKELCSVLNIGQSTLSGWENGKITVDGNALIHLCEIFGVSADYLLEMTDEPNGRIENTATSSEDDGEYITCPDELSLIHIYRELSQDSRTLVRDLAHYQYTNVEKIPATKYFELVLDNIQNRENKLNALAGILQLLRNYYGNISAPAVRILLDVVIEVLQHHTEVPDIAGWNRAMGNYFAKNIPTGQSGFLNRLKAKFESSEFTLADIVDLALYLREHHEELSTRQLEHLLRIIETTMRDDAKAVNASALEAKCTYYADQVQAALDMTRTREA